MRSTGRRPRRLLSVLAAVGPLIAGAVLAAPASAAPSPAAPADGPWAARAAGSYAALLDHLYLGASGHGLFQEQTPKQPTDNPYSYLWEYREATQATFDLANVPGLGRKYGPDVQDRLTALGQYASTDPAHSGYDSYLPAPLGTGGDLFYDDNAVVGITLTDQYRASGDRGLLDAARAQFTTDLRGWDSDTARACPGGMHWVESDSNAMRAANVTGLFAQLSANLYEITHQRTYLDWAQRAYDWNRTCLRQAPGLYANDLGDDGTLNTTLWSYNSGAMIGAATVLYRATGKSAYLHDAVDDANGALAYYGAESRLYDQPAIFNSFFFQDLLLLDSVHHDARYRATLAAYAQRLWTDNRDPATGLFHFQGSNGGTPDPALPVGTLNQSAAVQLFALLAWDPKDYHRIT
ncbi:glycoside hydrolase family 76 protein [Streptomyces sp. NBC_01497]|uniref:glycoside hydrolase family 76 protein n=1 Tax=Streptomyces sp. NBC_01497 TaxID=2903885 RepID=UPI002E31CA67|nr:glycoside hydrolase family 76 protein [Streptomyces sp. NBC_01497]